MRAKSDWVSLRLTSDHTAVRSHGKTIRRYLTSRRYEISQSGKSRKEIEVTYGPWEHVTRTPRPRFIELASLHPVELTNFHPSFSAVGSRMPPEYPRAVVPVSFGCEVG